jgi:hypothetical protein
MNPSAKLDSAKLDPGKPGRWTRERWAKIAIMVLFLMLVRTLSEYFRLKATLGPRFAVATAEPYVVGSLAISVFCWMAVGCFFFRRYTAVIAISIVTVAVMMIYKVYVIGI